MVKRRGASSSLRKTVQYADICMGQGEGYDWVGRFKVGRTSVARSCRPSTVPSVEIKGTYRSVYAGQLKNQYC